MGMNPYRKILDAATHGAGVWLSDEDCAVLAQDETIVDMASVNDADETSLVAASFQWCNDVNYENVNLGD